MATATSKRTRLSPHELRSQGMRSRTLRGSYDAAQTTHENANHWNAADHLSANAAHNPAVRRILRQRARYEYANNSYCRGMLLTSANDVVGTGPRLQLLHTDRTAANMIEHEFERWCRETRLAEKLRAMMLARRRDGEAFALKVNNRNLRHPVKLDVRLVECDHFTTPMPTLRQPQLTDGIIYDDVGNPAAYHMLKRHPGEQEFAGITAAPLDFDTIPARHVRHLFRVERPGQTRGVPEIAPALPLYALLRRWTLAVVRSAENIADLTLLLKSNLPPEDAEEALTAFDAIDLERGMIAGLPDGYEPWQAKAEQPGGTYVEGKNAILNEIARCLNMPFNVAAGNSSNYNYASGRLDHQVYDKSIQIDRDDLECCILDWLCDEWLYEASRLPGYLPIPDADHTIEREFFWPGREHVDPAKEANAQKTRLGNLTTSLAYEYARQGRDWEKELQQIAKERATMRDLGLSLDDIAASPNAPGTGTDAITEAVEDAVQEATR